MKKILKCTVNGVVIEKNVEESAMLLSFLRNDLGLTGTKEGCGEGDCGACTVMVDGKTVNSCIYPALLADGREILTIEGIEKNPETAKIQEAFKNHAAVQCGFCSPGMIMSAYYLLKNNQHPTEAEIRRGISGNLCRCTGYQQIVDAIEELAKV